MSSLCIGVQSFAESVITSSGPGTIAKLVKVRLYQLQPSHNVYHCHAGSSRQCYWCWKRYNYDAELGKEASLWCHVLYITLSKLQVLCSGL